MTLKCSYYWSALVQSIYNRNCHMLVVGLENNQHMFAGNGIYGRRYVCCRIYWHWLLLSLTGTILPIQTGVQWAMTVQLTCSDSPFSHHILSIYKSNSQDSLLGFLQEKGTKNPTLARCCLCRYTMYIFGMYRKKQELL